MSPLVEPRFYAFPDGPHSFAVIDQDAMFHERIVVERQPLDDVADFVSRFPSGAITVDLFDDTWRDAEREGSGT